MKRLMAYARSQRSQGLTEFAIIAPVILLLTFGIIDFGRALYLYITLQQAANEGARVAVRASYFIDPNGTSHTWPTDSDVANAIAGHAVIMNLANNPACPNGPLPNGGIPQGSPSIQAAATSIAATSRRPSMRRPWPRVTGGKTSRTSTAWSSRSRSRSTRTICAYTRRIRLSATPAPWWAHTRTCRRTLTTTHS